ncbi:MAG: hypothetical protein AMXMBFR82_08100 [Candidatus Hydrogenedentota bacterium]
MPHTRDECPGTDKEWQFRPKTKLGRNVDCLIVSRFLAELVQPLETPEGLQMMVVRRTAVEGVFARNNGLRGWIRSRRRGLNVVQAEMKRHQRAHGLCPQTGVGQSMAPPEDQNTREPN